MFLDHACGSCKKSLNLTYVTLRRILIKFFCTNAQILVGDGHSMQLCWWWQQQPGSEEIRSTSEDDDDDTLPWKQDVEKKKCGESFMPRKTSNYHEECVIALSILNLQLFNNFARYLFAAFYRVFS